MVMEKLEYAPTNESPERIAPGEFALALQDLANSYQDLRGRANSMEAQLDALRDQLAHIEERLSIMPAQRGLLAEHGSVDDGRIDSTNIIPSGEVGTEQEQSSIEQDLDTVTFESAKSEPHVIGDDLILNRKKDVWKMAGGGVGRFHNSIYSSLVDTKVDESDISFMTSPNADKIFPQQLETFRQRWAKKSRGVASHNGDKAYVNIYEQQGTFTHFHSEAFMDVVANGGKVDMDSRFYLNPRLADSVGILERIMDEANRQGLVVSGKINGNQLRIYPEFYRKQKDQYDSGERDIRVVNIRTDNIVMYSTAEQRDKFLSIIKQTYADNKASFVGRACPAAPLRIADGFAIGEEPKGHGEKESLTGLIAKVLHDAMVDADKRTWLRTNGEVGDISDEDWLREVRRSWSRIASARGINQTNIAFRQ